MRRPYLAGIFMALATPSVAFALLTGTAHDFEFGPVEPEPSGCASLCHSTLDGASSLGQVEQAWLANLQRDNTVGAAAAMCGSCHLSGGGYSAVMQAAMSDNNVFGENSHGRKMSLAGPPPGTRPAESGLPRVDEEAGIFQCSTCHNPHDDTFRPFLRADIRLLCVRCHAQRGFVAGVEQKGPGAESGAWQLATYSGDSNPGSHPVGEDVTQGRTDGPPVTVPAKFRVPFASGPLRWSPGGHLSGGDTGGVSCISCHAVHGADPDPDDPAAAGERVSPPPAFLALPQLTETIAGSARPLANGHGGWSALCEACHGVGNNPAADPGGTAWGDEGRNVHPGTTGLFSHPVDSYPSRYETGVTAFPEGWPSGDGALAGRNVSPVPICGSCHLAHPAAARGAGRVDATASAGPHLLRAAMTKQGLAETLCDRCHKTSIPSHHPAGKPFNSTGVPYLQAVSRGPGDRLTCGTCHRSAHDWRGPGEAGLDPFWLPANNGRRALQADDMYNRDMSKTCMDCHYAMDGDATSFNPTMGTAQTVTDSAAKEYPHYQKVDRGNGTHYIGLIHEEGVEAHWFLNPVVDLWNLSKSWKAQVPSLAAALADGWARFGGEDRKGARVLVCESCHELQPRRNAGIPHMLLAPYAEGRNGRDEFAGDVDGKDILCEACHGVPSGSHPMTGTIVTRTNRPLNPANEWVRQEILGHATLDPSGAMSCDSCHQPHDANSAARTACLDVPESLVLPGREEPVRIPEGQLANPNPAETTGYSTLKYATPKTLPGRSFAALCEQCHHYW